MHELRTPSPSVAAIMPTRNRRRFVSQSILYFLRQDYERKQLVVVDDGEDRIEDLIPDDSRIRYVHVGRRLSIGAKRNFACELTDAELIAHWDDDDWMAAHRLTAQVTALLSSASDLCGLRELLYYKPDDGEAWLYSFPGARRWIAGGTLMYRRAVWAKTRFPDTDIGEDTAFVQRQAVERVTVINDLSFYMGVIHAGNTSPKQLTGRHWQRRPIEEITSRIGSDAEFYGNSPLRGKGGDAAPTKKISRSLHSGRRRGGSIGGLNEPPRPRPAKEKGCFLDGAATPPLPRRGLLPLPLHPLPLNRPLVSCIMPTHNRRRFVSRAIEYFQRQDYPNRELIIVDDGVDSVRDLIPEDPAIRYLRLTSKCSTGAKRNRACEIARGNIVVLWDDDDWFSDNRISYQVAPLLSGRADVTALGNSMVYHQPSRQFWVCNSRLHSRMFYQSVIGGTLAFRKRLWRNHGFPDVSEREDAAFLEMMLGRGARLEKLPNAGVFIYVRHQSNTWQFMPGDFLDGEGWQQVSPPAFLPEADRQFYGVESSEPLVSCILTTANRQRFLKQAVKYALDQTYNKKEIIVVDDGYQSAEAMIPADERIQYVRLTQRVTLGKKLNIGIEHAGGDIIQKLDDDDYYHPSFLQRTVAALLRDDPENSIAGFDCFLVLIAGTGDVKFSGHGWFAGGTLCFHRKLWEAAPFRDVPSAVDWYFLQDHKARQIKLQDPELYILVRHDEGHLWTNLGSTDVTAYFAQLPAHSKRLRDCLPAVDLSFYETLRKEGVTHAS
jgi:glycosyltransferase involved in cell wall biosynthesis